MKKLFVAHSKGTEDLDSLLGKLRGSLHAHNFEAELTLGRDDYQRNFKQCGSWDKWIEHVILDRDFASGRLVYDGLIVPDKKVGKATAKMVELGLVSERTILYFDGHDFHSVRGIRQTDSKDFKAGWELIL